MSNCPPDCENRGSNEAVEVEKKINQQLPEEVVDEGLQEPLSCLPECADFISQTMDQICAEREDSRGPTEPSTQTRAATATNDASEKTAVEQFLGMDGQVWQRRGRFLVWPVNEGRV